MTLSTLIRPSQGQSCVWENYTLISNARTWQRGSTFSSWVTWAVPIHVLEMTDVHQPHQAGVSIPSLGRAWGWLSLLQQEILNFLLPLPRRRIIVSGLGNTESHQNCSTQQKVASKKCFKLLDAWWACTKSYYPSIYWKAKRSKLSGAHKALFVVAMWSFSLLPYPAEPSGNLIRGGCVLTRPRRRWLITGRMQPFSWIYLWHHLLWIRIIISHNLETMLFSKLR